MSYQVFGAAVASPEPQTPGQSTYSSKYRLLRSLFATTESIPRAGVRAFSLLHPLFWPPDADLTAREPGKRCSAYTLSHEPSQARHCHVYEYCIVPAQPFLCRASQTEAWHSSQLWHRKLEATSAALLLASLWVYRGGTTVASVRRKKRFQSLVHWPEVPHFGSGG